MSHTGAIWPNDETRYTEWPGPIEFVTKAIMMSEQNYLT